jgi:hypothetical protein
LAGDDIEAMNDMKSTAGFVPPGARVRQTQIVGLINR